MENTITIEFEKPIHHAGQDYNEITINEPTAGQLEKSMNAKTDMAAVIDLISSAAAVPRKVVELMPQSKFKVAADFLGEFSKDSL